MDTRKNGAVVAQLERPAQTLRRTCRFDVLTPSGGWDWWPEIFDGMNLARSASGSSLVVRPLGHIAQRGALFRGCDQLDEVDGVVVLGLRVSAELLDWLISLDVPVVLGEVEDPEFSSVAIDHEGALAAALRDLFALGHRRIALVEQSSTSLLLEGVVRARRSAYRTVLAEAGIVAPVNYEAILAETDASAATLVSAWLAAAEPPTAVICGSDRLAMRMCGAARECGLRIPDDVSVIGYGDSLAAEYLGLAAVRLPLSALGQRLVHLLLDQVDGSYSEPVRVRLTGELVNRPTSSAPPPDTYWSLSTKTGLAPQQSTL